MAAIRRWMRTGILAVLLMTVSIGLSAARLNDFDSETLVSYLPPGNAITDGQALLRYSLPIDNDEVRTLQSSLEDISYQLRGKQWPKVKKDISTASRMLTFREEKLLASVPAERRVEAEALVKELQAGLVPLREAAEAKDKTSIYPQRAQLLTLVGELEKTMLGDFPFEVPEEYDYLPQLKGRATVEFKTNKGDVRAILDGYSAPVTAGNFADLVQRGFYDGLEFTRAEDYYVLQIGDPPGPEEGFVDPETGEYRAIPLEILVQGDEEPIYEFTLESIGRFKDEPVLPFSAFGTLGMARPGEDPNGASSQFFFFLFEPELTPAGLNLIDGRYAGFGYVVEGKEVLEKLKLGDKIESAQIVEGAENLVQPVDA